MQKLAIIGSGLSALTLANKIGNSFDVTLFEKARGVSGRMSTRRSGEYHFDHGAQFFTIKNEELRELFQPLLDEKIIDIWHARFAELEGSLITSKRNWNADYPHYVGTPAMNIINKHLAKNLNVKVATRVESLVKNNDKWHLFSDKNEFLGEFDWVVSTAPAEQTTQLFPEEFEHYDKISSTKMLACFSLMLGFDKPLEMEFDVALVKNMDISWISVNSTKPQRGDKFTLLVHSTNKWAERHIDDDKEQVIKYLCDQTSKTIGHDVSTASHIDVHGWRYANIGKQKYDANLIDKNMKLAACGDWLIRGRIESAFEAANNLAKEFNGLI